MSSLWLAPNAWDATRLRSLMLCRRRFQLEQVMQLRSISRGFNIDPEWGTAWHEVTRAYDTARLSVPQDALRLATQRALALTAQWQTNDITTAKNRATLVRSIVWYDDQFGVDNPLKPLVFESGLPAMELAFHFPLFPDQPEGPQLCGNLDGVVEFGGEIWVLERKSTGSALSGFYWAKYDPNIQVDTYCLAAGLLWPEWRVQGTLVEACQVGVTFSRFERRQFRRTQARRAETLEAIQTAVSDFSFDLEHADDPFKPNFASCMADGGCPYRAYCQTDPSLRPWLLKTQFVPRENPWNPLVGNQKQEVEPD